MNKILQGDALTVLKTLPDESINCVMTSPPYWGLRDYNVELQLGLESTFQEYIMNLCNIFDEVKRVLRKDGTCWINLGDTYISKGEKRHIGYGDPKNMKVGIKTYIEPNGLPQSCTQKCLAQIPSRFAIEMCNRGWILRNEIIWHKPNAMPSSVKDRFTVDFEKLFFFVKSKKYWFQTQYEVATSTDNYIRDHTNTKLNNTPGRSRMGGLKTNHYIKRNMRSVWKIPTHPFAEAHFATYPEKLCEIPIKSGCPPQGIVLDPFFGAGTTGVVAKRQGKQFIGIELNPTYMSIAKRRLEKVDIPLELMG